MKNKFLLIFTILLIFIVGKDVEAETIYTAKFGAFGNGNYNWATGYDPSKNSYYPINVSSIEKVSSTGEVLYCISPMKDGSYSSDYHGNARSVLISKYSDRSSDSCNTRSFECSFN